MNIVEVDYSDLCGKSFNGYELHLALRRKGIQAAQIVKWKESSLNSVSAYADDKVLDYQIRELEDRYSIQNLLFPYAEELKKMEEFQKADIVHYHLIHKGAFSLLDIPILMNEKRSVWTIHDPWIVTGNCVHPLGCTQWGDGCKDCRQLNDGYFRMRENNVQFMWEVKKDILGRINPVIVVASDFMKRYIQKSPITRHFHKIYKIPFGVEITKYQLGKRGMYRRKFGVPDHKFVLAFRCDDVEIKGCRYLYDALRMIGGDEEIFLFCVGGGTIPEDIEKKYHLINFGWVDDDKQIAEILGASDLFIMPSLAESFGLMAVEAMAAGCTVICFENTVVAEVINAPHCGISVSYGAAGAIAKEIITLKKERENVKVRGHKGHELVKEKYRFDEYVHQHIALYEKMMGGEV